ncbi:asparaginase [Nigerium massiliense]|uniref:asparaginase n=1 Tax=Nigerium massiliense TaxID=1522317 RepID=UPI00058B4D1D|nr:asparaginase [Nigerium massiliense]
MSLAKAPVVARVVRNGFVESLHHGLGVITGPDGDVCFAVGDPDTIVLPRSSNKPVQALAMLRRGSGLAGAQLALACSSHSGEGFHLSTVRDVLAGAGLSVADLGNTPDYPLDEEARLAWIASGRRKESLAQNCSGKHASMLVTAARNGWPTADYLDPHHPVQGGITETVEELTSATVTAMAVDGCGAPLHAVPLSGLARAFGRIAGAADGEERQVADAMRAHPEYVAGTRRDATRFMRAVPGLIAKDGAEGVYAAGLPDGRGIAVKIADGHERARAGLLAALLQVAGVAAESLAGVVDAPVLGHGRPVGAVETLPLR